MVAREDVVEALHGVEDPELGMDIVELGLMYDVEVDGPKVKILYSLTSMGCPAGAMIADGIVDAARVGSGRRGGRGGADVRPAVDARPHVGRREVHPRLRLALSAGSARVSPGIASTTLPNCAPDSRRSCAFAASASGKTLSTWTRARAARG